MILSQGLKKINFSFMVLLKHRFQKQHSINHIPIKNKFYTYTTDDGTGIITKAGTIILEAFFDEITPTQEPNIFYIERKEKGAYFNVNTLKFIWQESGFNPAYI